MSELTVKGLSRKAGKVTLFQDICLKMKPGELIVLLGPNGAGKSSLLQTIVGYTPADEGSVMLDGADVLRMSPKNRARYMSYLPQKRHFAWPLKVKDVLKLGRFSQVVQTLPEHVLNKFGEKYNLFELLERTVDTLSGGELARVHCARLFASKTPFVFADEPIVGLDPKYQFEVLDIFKEYTINRGCAIIVLHDFELAARYADRLIWLKNGKVLADGPPQETLTTARIDDIYNVTSKFVGEHVQIHPKSN